MFRVQKWSGNNISTPGQDREARGNKRTVSIPAECVDVSSLGCSCQELSELTRIKESRKTLDILYIFIRYLPIVSVTFKEACDQGGRRT